MFGIIRIGLSFLPLDSLSQPLGGSSWSLRRVLQVIEDRRSSSALIVLYHITSCHMISSYIITCYIISHHKISYYIILFYIIFSCIIY